MSFVSVVATLNYCCVMSDGLVKNIITGEVIQEDYQKFRTYNDSTSFIAYTGYTELGKNIMDRIYTSTNDFNQWATSLINIIKTQELRSSLALNPDSFLKLVFGGLNERKIIELFSWESSSPLNVEKLTLPKERAQQLLCFLGDDSLLKPAYDYYNTELKLKKHNGPKDHLKTMKRLNDYISKSSEYVNKKTFKAIIC